MPTESRFAVRTVSALGDAARPPLRRPSGAPGCGSADGGAPVARPRTWLGAPAPGGLTLPPAMPSGHQMYGPRSTWIDERCVVVADTGNHRVLIWHDANPAGHSSADVVLGQAAFTDEGPQAAGRGPERGLHLPVGVLVHDERLVVADAWNHRILVWDTVPERSDTPPDIVLGQPNPASVEPNRGEGCGPLGFYWPFGVAIVAGRFYVADTGNRRVLVWDGIPEPDDQPMVVLGQADAHSRDENRGELGPASFRWPHAITGTADRLLIADAGNHRLLGWSPRPDADRPADVVFGQPDFVTGTEFPYRPQTAGALRFPYAAAVDEFGTRLAVADTANNRVLLWGAVPGMSRVPADHVLGQPDFAANGENRWDVVGDDTLCWPYGLCLSGGRLAVADSGNNRVMIWELLR